MAFAPKRPVLAKKRRAQALSKSDNNKVVLERVLGLTCVSSNSLALSISSQCIVYTAGCTVVLFYPKKNKQDHIINPSRKPISCICIGSNKYLAYGEYGHAPLIRIWDISVTPPAEISKLDGHKFGVSCLSFSPNLRYLVSVGYQHDQNIFVWSWKSSVKLATNKLSTKVSGISFSEDGKYFVTAGNRRVRYWYFDTTAAKDIRSKPTLPLNGRSAILGEQQSSKFVAVACGRGSFSKYTYAVSANGFLYQFNEEREIDKMLDVQSVGCVEGIIRVFDPVTLKYVISLPRPHSLGVNLLSANTLSCDEGRHPDTVAMAYSSTSNKLVVIYNDHSLYTWDIRNLDQIGKTYSSLFHNACVWDLSVYSSQDSKVLPMNTLISCSSDNTIRFWALDGNGSGELCFKNIYSKELIRIIYDMEDIGCLRDNSKLLGDSSAVSDATRGTRCVDLHPLGHQIATGDRMGNLKVYDLDFLDKSHDIMAHDAEILTITYSSLKDNGTLWLATGSRDRLIHLFDVATGYTHAHTISDHSAAITSIKFIVSPDSIVLVSSGADKSLMMQELKEQHDSVSSTPTPPSGGSSSGGIKRVNHVVEKSTVYDMVVDPLLKTITTVGQDRTIRVYHASSCKQKLSFKGGPSDEGSGLLKVAIDPSGLYIATSGSDKIVCLFEFATGECIARLHGHSEVITALKFSKCCKFLYTASGDSCIFVWKLSSEMTQRMHDRLIEIGLATEIQPIERFRKRTFCISSSKPTGHTLSESCQSSCDQTSHDLVTTTSSLGGNRLSQDGGQDITDSIDQDVFEGDEAFKFEFELDQLPAWVQNQLITRPSIAQTIGIDLEQQDQLTIKESSSHVSHVTGKWAERASESIHVMSTTTESLSDTFDNDSNQSVLNFEAKLQLNDVPLNIEEEEVEEQVLETDEEVVYPIKEKDSIDPSIFKVSTPEKRSSPLPLPPFLDNNKENIPQSNDIIVQEEEEDFEEEETDTSPSSNHQETFLKAHFESLTEDELFQRQELMEELAQLSPRRPSISTMYLKKARSRILQGSPTDPSPSSRPCVSPLSINVTTPPNSDISINEQLDQIKLSSSTFETNEIMSSEPISNGVKEPVGIVDTPPTNESKKDEVLSCDDHTEELQSRPRPVSDNKNKKNKITVEEIDKARKRLEELGYSDEYIHGNKSKKKEDVPVDIQCVPDSDQVDYEEVKGDVVAITDEEGTLTEIDSARDSFRDKILTLASDLSSLMLTVDQVNFPEAFVTESSSVLETMKRSIVDLEVAIKRKSSSQCTAGATGQYDPDSPTYDYLSSSPVPDPMDKTPDPSRNDLLAPPDPLLTIPDHSSEDPIQQSTKGTRDIGTQVTIPDPVDIRPLLENYSQQIVEVVKIKLSSIN